MVFIHFVAFLSGFVADAVQDFFFPFFGFSESLV